MALVKYSRYYTYIKPVTENKFVRSYSPYIFSLITIAILLISAIRPTVETVLSLQKEIDNNKKVLETLKDKGKNLILGNNNYESLGQDLQTKLQRAIPQNPDVASLVKSLKLGLESSASSTIQIQPANLIDSSSEQSKLALGNLVFTFNIEGSYDKFLNILTNLDSASRLINIDSISITRQQAGSAVLSINGKAYFLK